MFRPKKNGRTVPVVPLLALSFVVCPLLAACATATRRHKHVAFQESQNSQDPVVFFHNKPMWSVTAYVVTYGSEKNP